MANNLDNKLRKIVSELTDSGSELGELQDWGVSQLKQLFEDEFLKREKQMKRKSKKILKLGQEASEWLKTEDYD